MAAKTWQCFNACKVSYKVVRENSAEIYKGFGFCHLSDATQYYVHPDNQSYRGKTTLCQPIGEAVILFSLLLREIAEGNRIGDYYYSADRRHVALVVDVPEDYRQNGVVDARIFGYRAEICEDRVFLSAHDAAGSWIPGDMEHLHPLYKLLPLFMLLCAREMETDPGYHTRMLEFSEEPAADTFVNLHEDLYQAHKYEELRAEYRDLSGMDVSGYFSYAESCRVIRENRKQKQEQKEQQKHLPIVPFAADSFTEEQKACIPKLSGEFVLPEELHSICNAVAARDMLAVLFHGPAGTGKTMACKLVAQAIGLPILETINCTENLDEFVLGKYIPRDDRIIFQESYVTKAIREGGAVVFEEINFAKPQHLAFLNSLLDDNGFVRLDNGGVVYRHPNFRFFATMNLGYFGTRELNQALYNRFSGIVEIAALPDEAITRMLCARVPECTPVVDKLLGVYHKIKRKIEAEELDVVISPRNLENWARLAKYEGYLAAAEKTLIPIARCDRALEETIRGILMLYQWK